MGRHRKYPTRNNDVRKESSVQSHNVSRVVEERLGLTKDICMSCNARNPENSDICRKCGHTELRPKRYDYADG